MFIEEEERREREGLDYATLGVKKASSRRIPVEFLRVPGLRKISPTVSFYLTSCLQSGFSSCDSELSE